MTQYQPAAPPLTHYKPVATKSVYHPPPPVTHHVGYSHELPYAIPIVLKHSYPCEPKKKEDRKYFCHCSEFSFTRETAVNCLIFQPLLPLKLLKSTRKISRENIKMIKRKMKGGKNSMLIMKTFLTAMPSLTKTRVASSARFTTLLTKMMRSFYKHSGELKTLIRKLRKMMTERKCKWHMRIGRN